MWWISGLESVTLSSWKIGQAFLSIPNPQGMMVWAGSRNETVWTYSASGRQWVVDQIRQLTCCKGFEIRNPLLIIIHLFYFFPYLLYKVVWLHFCDPPCQPCTTLIFMLKFHLWYQSIPYQYPCKKRWHESPRWLPSKIPSQQQPRPLWLGIWPCTLENHQWNPNI